MNLISQQLENLIQYQWVQFIAEEEISVRAITLSHDCPALGIANQCHIMEVRARTQDLVARQLTICEFNYKRTNADIYLNGKKLPVVPFKINNFTMISDSGCNENLIKNHQRINCVDNKEWSFPKIAQDIAAIKPDLVIHLGDLVYTDYYNEQKIAGQVTSVLREFFEPAKILLAESPIIMVRGNHDNCKKGNAWSLFFATNKFSNDCLHITPNFSVTIGKIQFIIGDVSTNTYGKAIYSALELVQMLDKLKNIQSLITQDQVFICLHMPVVNMQDLIGIHSNQVKVISDASQQLIYHNVVFLSGHYHFSAFLEKNGIKQFISGNSGYDQELIAQDLNTKLAENFGSNSKVFGNHGYIKFKINGETWSAEFIDSADNSIHPISEFSFVGDDALFS